MFTTICKVISPDNMKAQWYSKSYWSTDSINVELESKLFLNEDPKFMLIGLKYDMPKIYDASCKVPFIAIVKNTFITNCLNE